MGRLLKWMKISFKFCFRKRKKYRSIIPHPDKYQLTHKYNQTNITFCCISLLFRSANAKFACLNLSSVALWSSCSLAKPVARPLIVSLNFFFSLANEPIWISRSAMAFLLSRTSSNRSLRLFSAVWYKAFNSAISAPSELNRLSNSEACSVLSASSFSDCSNCSCKSESFWEVFLAASAKLALVRFSSSISSCWSFRTISCFLRRMTRSSFCLVSCSRAWDSWSSERWLLRLYL